MEEKKLTDKLEEMYVSGKFNGEIIFNAIKTIYALQEKNAEQKAEIERLTEESNHFFLQMTTLEEIMDAQIQQAVKDTAKEILRELKNTRFHKGMLTYEFEMAVNKLAEKYGVEVE